MLLRDHLRANLDQLDFEQVLQENALRPDHVHLVKELILRRARINPIQDQLLIMRRQSFDRSSRLTLALIFLLDSTPLFILLLRPVNLIENIPLNKHSEHGSVFQLLEQLHI